ncbi:SHOCT domain-containing protein [Levilactobacillus lindianensis]|uniref:SHOCT domain-containing protein n=1 Tax=Levilactobacillus lindianensis TaxID=2486018 RepID=UPI001782CEFB|nr:SHOCT domain-containing protein [Levilactobacillus lindianensis]
MALFGNCSICGKKLKFWTMNYLVDGRLCGDCCKKVGLTEDIDHLTDVAGTYTVQEIRTLIDNHQKIDINHQEAKQAEPAEPTQDDLIANLKLYQEATVMAAYKITVKSGIDWSSVVIALRGTNKEYLIATNDQVAIIKTGFMTGHTLGSGVFRMPYSNITNAQVDYHMLSGYFEIAAGGVQNTAKNYWSTGSDSPQESPNTITLTGDALRQHFLQAADLINNYVALSHQPQAAVASPTQDPVDEIRKFKGLLDDGIITQEEFDTKKKQLLGL